MLRRKPKSKPASVTTSGVTKNQVSDRLQVHLSDRKEVHHTIKHFRRGRNKKAGPYDLHHQLIQKKVMLLANILRCDTWLPRPPPQIQMPKKAQKQQLGPLEDIRFYSLNQFKGDKWRNSHSLTSIVVKPESSLSTPMVYKGKV